MANVFDIKIIYRQYLKKAKVLSNLKKNTKEYRSQVGWKPMP